MSARKTRLISCNYQPPPFTGKGPRKGWRTPLNRIKYSEQRDEETGYGYFGARYMDYELMPMWLSVDPMADKYPNVSPYNYCMWNPVMLLDPNGDSVAVLLARGGTYGVGHMAILIQNSDNKWELWSENGGEMPLLGKISGRPM